MHVSAANQWRGTKWVISQSVKAIMGVRVISIEKSQIMWSTSIIGLSTTPSGQLVFRIDIFTKNGQQTHIYADFLKLCRSLIKENIIELPRFIGNPIAVK